MGKSTFAQTHCHTLLPLNLKLSVPAVFDGSDHDGTYVDALRQQIGQTSAVQEPGALP